MRSGSARRPGMQLPLPWGPALLLGTALLGAASGSRGGCFWDQGHLYQADQSFSADGLPCLNWQELQSQGTETVTTGAGPGRTTTRENHSFCRNPDSDAAGPWCYVSGSSGAPEKRRCQPVPCAGTPTQETLPLTTDAGASQESHGADGEVFEVAHSLPRNSESAAVQPVIGVSQRVRMMSEKKDLGMIGYVLGITMTVIIIAIGAGIVLGYVYKRGKDFKEHREQKTYEREMQRITLPLSAFTNPACEIVDEKTIVIHTHRTPGEDTKDGSAPLMGQAGTPGA
ncbi:phosphoinositide-3-kinase-interacting protein 1 [Phascolarctos cinereus]|uniref:Phosphoinositide-3-kinase-interacting protein 1 n=1 Tax=Phascolarctos cinereus TaxID=38626 RepID=A0A6P5L1E9_PHACI|nr:phosphoinositide-3-kinase-interacting protein 1 [Phascolarctos cinereus]